MGPEITIERMNRELVLMKEHMPENYYRTIGDQLGIHHNTVMNIMSGRYKSITDKVLEVHAAAREILVKVDSELSVKSVSRRRVLRMTDPTRPAECTGECNWGGVTEARCFSCGARETEEVKE